MMQFEEPILFHEEKESKWKKPLVLIACTIFLILIIVLVVLVIKRPYKRVDDSPPPRVKLEILLPAYFRNESLWQAMTAAASQISITAVVNPDIGPAESPTYESLIEVFRAAGGKVLGFVSTSYGEVSLEDILNTVDLWISLYEIDGFYMDNFISDSKDSAVVDKMKAVYEHIKSKNASFLVVANSGTTVDRDLLDAQVADRFVVFRNFYSNYSSFEAPNDYFDYSPSKFAHIVYSAPSIVEMCNSLLIAKANHAGSIYVTDAIPGANVSQYSLLPTYWQAETALVQLDIDSCGNS